MLMQSTAVEETCSATNATTAAIDPPLGVNGAKVCVLEQADQVRLGSLLQRQHSAALETQVSLEVLGDFTNQALEWELPNEQLSRLLILANLTQGNCAWPVAMWFLHTTSCWC